MRFSATLPRKDLSHTNENGPTGVKRPHFAAKTVTFVDFFIFINKTVTFPTRHFSVNDAKV